MIAIGIISSVPCIASHNLRKAGALRCYAIAPLRLNTFFNHDNTESLLRDHGVTRS